MRLDHYFVRVRDSQSPFDEIKTAACGHRRGREHGAVNAGKKLLFQQPRNVNRRGVKEDAAPALLAPVNEARFVARHYELKVELQALGSAKYVIKLRRRISDYGERRCQPINRSRKRDVCFARGSRFEYRLRCQRERRKIH